MPTTDTATDLWETFQRELGNDWMGQPLEEAGWSFGFDHAKRRFGNTDFKNKEITLSKTLIGEGLPREEIEDTLRHEIAHVLDYINRGTSDHGPKWKRWARRCGADPTRAGQLPEKYMPDYRWWLVCPECDKAVKGYYRKPKLNKYHPRCGTDLELEKGPAHPER